jgi:tetratricopeptide (TPR) repeat protein
MKTKLTAVLLALALISVAAVPAAAQAGYAKVKGKVTDQKGQPMVDVAVDFVAASNGQKIHLKTDKRGEFYSIGVSPGIYKVTFSKDGKQFWIADNFNVSLQKDDSMNTLDLDLAKEYAAAQKGHGLTDAQKKEMEAVEKENKKIGGLNEMLAQARAAQDAGNLDQAVSLMTQATQIDPTKDLLWGRLAEIQLISAKKDTDPASRTQKYTDAAANYKKAIELASTSTAANSKTMLGPYNNNLGEALAKTGKTEDAVAAYNNAAQVDPANAGMYYFNLGATMTNANKPDEAIAAYDKAIAADPAKADAYYLKGIALLGKATIKGDKMVPAPGTADSFNKYLELAPEGQYAETAKQMLASIGATVQTTYGKKKK